MGVVYQNGHGLVKVFLCASRAILQAHRAGHAQKGFRGNRAETEDNHRFITSQPLALSQPAGENKELATSEYSRLRS